MAASPPSRVCGVVAACQQGGTELLCVGLVWCAGQHGAHLRLGEQLGQVVEGPQACVLLGGGGGRGSGGEGLHQVGGGVGGRRALLVLGGHRA